MSHFSTLVFTTEKPTKQLLAEILQPYHQFECTGEDDQYVQDVDITVEAYEKFKKDTERYLVDKEGAVVGGAYEDQFYRDPTKEEQELIGKCAGTGCSGGLSYCSKDWDDDKGYRTKVRFIPEGLEEKVLPTRATFAEWLNDYYGYEVLSSGKDIDKEGKHKYGYVLAFKLLPREDAKEVPITDLYRVIDRTNPNYHWDWWQVGGRYKDRLHMKTQPFAHLDLNKIDFSKACELLNLTGHITPAIVKEAYRKAASAHHPDKGGYSSVMQAINIAYEKLVDYDGVSGYKGNAPEQSSSYFIACNSAQIAHIDFEGMLREKHKQAAKIWKEEETKFIAKAEKAGWKASFSDTLKQWSEILKTLKAEIKDKEGVRLSDAVTANETANKLRNLVEAGGYFDTIEEGTTTLEELKQQEYFAYALSAFSYVKDGKWFQNGDMLMFGMTANETMSELEWSKHVDEVLKSLPQETYVTVIDCHI